MFQLLVKLSNPISKDHPLITLLVLKLLSALVDDALESDCVNGHVFAVEGQGGDQVFDFVLGQASFKFLKSKNELFLSDSCYSSAASTLVLPLGEKTLESGGLLEHDRVDGDEGLVDPVVVAAGDNRVVKLLLCEPSLALLLLNKRLLLLVSHSLLRLLDA